MISLGSLVVGTMGMHRDGACMNRSRESHHESATPTRRRPSTTVCAVLRAALLLAVALLLAGTSAASTRKDGEGRLDLVAYPGYAEAGGEDPRVNWVQPFVHLTGCKVHVRTVRSSTELLDVVAGARTLRRGRGLRGHHPGADRRSTRSSRSTQRASRTTHASTRR